MAGYSIGDRVEVRWGAEPFAAKVIHVHSAGKVDVVYDIDGSVFANSRILPSLGLGTVANAITA